jgi:sugar phosphate isomerase/epimerase
MGKIFCLDGPGDIDVTALLEMAKQNNYTSVVVVGVTQDNEVAVQSSDAKIRHVHWLLVKAAQFILDL